MLLISDRSRKLSGTLFTVWTIGFTLMPSYMAVAESPAFAAGREAGQQGLVNATRVFTDPTQLQSLGMSGLGTTPAPSNITQYYKGAGKNGLDSITAINQAGVQAMQQAQQGCAVGDAGCKALQVGAQKFNNQLNGTDPRAQFKAEAQALRAAQLQQDPLAVLGIGIPAANKGTVCIESTANLPTRYEQKQCVQAKMKTLHNLAKLPVSTGYSYTQPYCIDPTMTLSANQSLCSKTVYSCPNGGTLNGTQCVISTNAKPITYSGCATAQSGGSWTQYIANGQDWWDVQAMCSPDGQNIQVYANAAGGWGNGGTAGYWATLPIGSYNQRYTHVSTPSWNSQLQAYATAVTGGCSNGTCNYNISFDWARFGVAVSGCNQWQYDWMTDTSYCSSPYSSIDYFHNLNDCYGYDNEGYCNQYTTADHVRIALTNQWIQAGFTARTTLSFPQNATQPCDPGQSYQNGQCLTTYPATVSHSTASPGCLGAPIPDGAVSGGTMLVAAMVNGEAGMTCQTTHYSCPSTMNMNGMLCEDPLKPNYQNPNCTNLGYDPNVKSEQYLCLNHQLDECADLDLTQCSETSNKCIYADEMVGSPDYGQCIANEKTFSCPIPAQTIKSTSCGYEPMCYNGNCFTPPGTNCKGTTVNQVKTEPNSCGIQTPQQYRQCSLSEQKNNNGQVTGFQPGADCANINNKGTPMTCTMIPPIFNSETGHYPTQLNYSCVGSPVDSCGSIASKAGCSLSSSQCIEHQCLDPIPTAGSQEQAGDQSQMLGNTLQPSGLNTCSNKGVCLMEERTYGCQVTTSMPGDECTTDLSQVLVSMETARQAGTYMNPDDLKIFKGEFSRCDRRAFSVMGAGLGSKSCCNISAPDAKSNADILNAPNSTGLIIGGATKASGYVYDYMMSSSSFTDAALSAWSNGVLTDGMAQAGLNASMSSAQSLANFNIANLASYSPIAGVGLGAGPALGGAAAGTSTTLGMTTTTSSFAGGTINLSFTPAVFYVAVAMKVWQMYNAALACDEQDFNTATKTNGKLCYNTGTWCEKKDCGLFGCTCVKYRTGKCCFNSKLSRIINEQGRAQLGLNMRDCGGFSTTQIQQLDWSRIDLSEFIADMLAQAQASTAIIMSATTQSSLNSKIQTNATNIGVTKTQPSLPVLKPTSQ